MKVLILFLFLVTSCSGMDVYTPARIDPHDSRQITDDDIRKAYEASPQLNAVSNISVFNAGPERGDISKLISSYPFAGKIYKIPALLATGMVDNRRHPHRYEESKPIDIKRLRLIAARAHSDIVFITMLTHEWSTSPNGWVAASIIPVTPLFLPMFDVTVKSRLRVWMFDVRNGFMYASMDFSEKASSDTHTLYSIDSTEEKLKRNNRKVLENRFSLEIQKVYKSYLKK
ncbi:hypothetical protein KKF34_17920 [Myxococcota bacterium]|nr:hypothetical protein [Myxococcota bacterium]MBU1379877.1 hypothetical protein [Myxococcota bacterium]MBU1498762.1 hypothetical protein [Myxococcota bacterium]